MRLAVVIAGVAADRVLDLAQFRDGHGGGAGDGFAVLLLQLEPDGVRAGFGETGQSSAVCAVLGGRVGHAHTLGGDVQRDGVRCAVVIAIVAADSILDDLLFNNGEAVADRCAIVATLAADGSGVAARRAGCAFQTEIALTVFNRPLLNLIGGKIELHGRSGAGEAARKRGFDLVADVKRMDLHGHRAFFGFVALLFEPVVNNVHIALGERGVGFAVRAFIGCGVTHAHAIRADSQRDRMGQAVVSDVKALDAVINFLFRLDDGERMEHIRVAVGTSADDFDAIAARFAGRSAQRRAIGIAIVDLPRLNAFVEGRKLHGISVIGKAALQAGFHRLAHVRPLDGNGFDAGFCFVKLLFDLIGDLIIACTGEFGVLAAVRTIYGIGVAHTCALRRGDAHRNRMRRAVVIAVVAAGAVYDFTCDLGSFFQRIATSQLIAVSRRIAAIRRIGVSGCIAAIRRIAVSGCIAISGRIAAIRHIAAIRRIAVSGRFAVSRQIASQRTAVFGQHGHGHHGRQQAQNQYHRANSPECSSHGWFLLSIVLNRRSYGKV